MSRFEVDSAAVSDEEEGNPIYPPAVKILRRHGIAVPAHCARQVTKDDFGKYDYLICMDRSNINLLHRWHGLPTGAGMCHIRLLMEYAGQYRDVADPWYTRDFASTFNDISLGCQCLLDSLVMNEG